MKESILRAAAIAALALALIMSVTTWVGVSTSPQRGSFLMGFFEFALILFLGAVAWALFNALADAVANRNTLEMLTVRMAKLESAVERLAPPEQAGTDTVGTATAGTATAGTATAGTATAGTGAAPNATEAADAASNAAPDADEERG